MKKWSVSLLVVGVSAALAGGAACSSEQEPEAGEELVCPVDYGSFTPRAEPVSLRREIVPLFRRACTGSDCHGTAFRPSANLYLAPRTGELAGALPGPCGDRVCSPSETAASCPVDCTTCGDGVCGLMETAVSCAGSRCDGTCGDGRCGNGETLESCATDCEASGCGDGVCRSKENSATCPADCGALCPADCAATCGDRVCDASETVESCPRDCTNETCGDGQCDGENVTTCRFDCGSCGDGFCGYGEPTRCPEDCAAGCGDGVCGGAETEATCPVDCLPDDFYPAFLSRLVNVDSRTAARAGVKLKLIAVAGGTGDLEGSFLQIKVDGCQNRLGLECTPQNNAVGCGDRMPDVTGGRLTDAELLLVRSWIAAGAPAD